MKIRNGFVSNSSSSSFMVVGKWLDEMPDDVDELEDNGVSVYEADDDGPCAGIDFDIKDDETWRQFKVRVALTLTNAGLPTTPDEVKICSGSYYC